MFDRIGDYTVLCPLASGGMARVVLAMKEQGRFRRLFAIKRILPGYAEVQAFREMFQNEARVAGLLRHPNVVPTVDFGEDQDGAYLVMEFVQGVSLATFLDDARAAGVLPPVQVVARILRDIARGLHSAHSAVDHDGSPLGIVHRDLSPQNVLLGWDGSVAIADFGVAKVRAFDAATEAGLVKGKRGYMSPEQILGRPLDPRSDLFSLGVILYECLTLERLYPVSPDVDNGWRILHEPPPDIGEIRDTGTDLVDLMFGLLAKEPEERVENAAEVESLFDGVLVRSLARDPEPLRVQSMLELVSGHRRAKEQRMIADAIQALEHGPRLATAERWALVRRAGPLVVLLFALLGAAFVWPHDGDPARTPPASVSTDEERESPRSPSQAPPAPEPPRVERAPAPRVSKPPASPRMGRSQPRPRMRMQANDEAGVNNEGDVADVPSAGVDFDEW